MAQQLLAVRRRWFNHPELKPNWAKLPLYQVGGILQLLENSRYCEDDDFYTDLHVRIIPVVSLQDIHSKETLVFQRRHHNQSSIFIHADGLHDRLNGEEPLQVKLQLVAQQLSGMLRQSFSDLEEGLSPGSVLEKLSNAQDSWLVRSQWKANTVYFLNRLLVDKRMLLPEPVFETVRWEQTVQLTRQVQSMPRQYDEVTRLFMTSSCKT